jgi:hypothetical protein
VNRRLFLNLLVAFFVLFAAGAMVAAQRSIAADRARRASLIRSMEEALARANTAIDRAQQLADKHPREWTDQDLARLRELKHDAEVAMGEATQLHGQINSHHDHALGWGLVAALCMFPAAVWVVARMVNGPTRRLRGLPRSEPL